MIGYLSKSRLTSLGIGCAKKRAPTLKALCDTSMNVTNPSIEEIKAWAYSSEEWPDDEWDLFLSWTSEVDLFVELAIDHNCPKRRFFLHMLYYIVGTTYSEPNKADKLDRIKAYEAKGAAAKHGDITVWRSHVADLLSGCSKYSYDNWRGGVYAGYKFT